MEFLPPPSCRSTGQNYREGFYSGHEIIAQRLRLTLRSAYGTPEPVLICIVRAKKLSKPHKSQGAVQVELEARKPWNATLLIIVSQGDRFSLRAGVVQWYAGLGPSIPALQLNIPIYGDMTIGRGRGLGSIPVQIS